MRSSQLLLQRLSKASASTKSISGAHTCSARASIRTQLQLPAELRTIQAAYPRLTIYSPNPSSKSTIFGGLRPFTASAAQQQQQQQQTPAFSAQNKSTVDKQEVPAQKTPQQKGIDEEELDHEQEERGFGRSEKASQATQVDLSARLSSPKDQNQGAGFQETWRLIKIARPEAGVLGWAFLFLIVSSSISMTIPWSIGKFLDVATKSGENGENQLYGFDLSTLYLALGGILIVGASANYGRIIILRIVGERIVARLRSQLFRRTFAQNAEFFDANRVGDLISRLSSDTVIVGKSITQNLSDGLRSFVSGVAGLSLMAYVSLKLTSVLAICFPPVAVGTVFYGRAIRNLSRRIQKALGTLTKIAEERLGNVRTSQAFAGEILEVSRYNKQVKKIFTLGKREAFISATYFSTVSSTLA